MGPLVHELGPRRLTRAEMSSQIDPGTAPPGDSSAGGAVGESGARIRKGARIARGTRAVVPDDTVSGPAGGLGFP